MKKIITKIVTSVSVIFLLSCQEQMSYNEFVNYDKNQVFSSFDRTGQFVSAIYAHLDYDFGKYGGAMMSSASDESEYAWAASEIHDFYNGAWSATNPKADSWAGAYNAIRACNIYLKESEGQTFEPFKYNRDYGEQMERFERYQYEVRFLRAYFYFLLVRQYGDVPFTTDVLTEAEANKLPRIDKEIIFEFIQQECESIASHLPINYAATAHKETGRVSRVAVLALKARMLLYKSSPLFNDGDKALWKEAALANKQVIDICAENNIRLGKYTDLWGSENYTAAEAIFVRRVGDLNSFERANFPIGVEGGNSGNCPTQTLVDAYEVKSTGKKWDEPGSGFDPSNPYDDRDPRLEMTIAKNGDIGWPAYNNRELQIYQGGANGAPISGATPTGYYLKKYADVTVDLRPNYVNQKRHSWITFRLAEFYLNYAEAVFQYLGSADATTVEFPLSAREAVNVVRSREGVGMPDFPEGMSNDDFMNKYMNERMVELAFEGHRFWDVRRWKKGEVFRVIYNSRIYKSSDGQLSFMREKKERIWDDKMYFFPIPDAEMRKNKELTQNPGW